jgi:predicted patatin/cPLA2 family phospholipase
MPEVLNPKQKEEKADYKFQDAEKTPVGGGNNHSFTEEEWVKENEKNNPDNFSREEFGVYQGSANQKFEKYGKDSKTLMFRILHGDEPKLKKIDFVQEQAMRDNEDWNRKYELVEGENKEYHKELQGEYREYLKMLQVVIEHIKAIRDDPEGEGKGRKVMILGLGGGLKGPYGAGQVLALNRLGLNKKFDVAVGISAGACDLAYMLAGDEKDDYRNTFEGASIYNEECCDTEFLITDPKYLVRHPGRIRRVMNVEVARDVMAGKRGNKRLNIENIQDNPTKFYVMATKVEIGANGKEKGIPELIDAKNSDAGVVESVHASMALPWVYGQRVQINQKNYIDGALTPLSLEEMIRKFRKEEGITDVLILPQAPFRTMAELDEEVESGKGKAGLIPGSLDISSAALLRKFLQSATGLKRDLQYAQKEFGVNIGVLFPPDEGLDITTQDPNQIKAAMLSAAKDACEVFGEPEKCKNLHLL